MVIWFPRGPFFFGDFRQGLLSMWFSWGPISKLRQLSHEAADFREGVLSRWFSRGPLSKLRHSFKPRRLLIFARAFVRGDFRDGLFQVNKLMTAMTAWEYSWGFEKCKYSWTITRDTPTYNIINNAPKAICGVTYNGNTRRVVWNSHIFQNNPWFP